MIQFGADDRFLVTGASSGIGRAVAQRLVGLGAAVIASGRDAARLEETRRGCDDPARCHVAPRDLAAEMGSIPAWVEGVARDHGPLAGLVHSAGVLGPAPLRVLSLKAARATMDVNFFSFLMLAQGLSFDGVARDGASLVAVSSVASLRGLSGAAPYSASKGAVNAAVRALGAELAPRRIRCNAVLPGVVDTEMTRGVEQEQLEYLWAQQFVPGSIGPGDVAGVCAWLLSDAGAFVTGQCVAIDAGSGEIPGPRPLNSGVVG